MLVIIYAMSHYVVYRQCVHHGVSELEWQKYMHW